MASHEIDPLTGSKCALSGRIVTMDAASTVVQRGTLYIDKGAIVAVQDNAAPPPEGFDGTEVVATGGTIFPGLIELHNHLAYNALRLWHVPRPADKPFTNRDQWGRIAEYRSGVSGPMQVLGRTPDAMPALIRYVECKCLLGGVTTSQGVELFSNHGIRRFYRGIVRNVEQTEEALLPEASAKIADVEAKDAAKLLARLKRRTCFLLHLSEGTDDAALKHFRALQISESEWAITRSLAGIHCAALKAADFEIMARHGGAMVWSPLSNLLLYGKTAQIKDARANGIRIGLGSDWSPTGSKNLLGELKVAKLASAQAGDVFSDRDIVAMATRDAAAILHWDGLLGSIEPGKRADLLVVDGLSGDPYSPLFEATETSIRLILINGVPRYGHPGLMEQLGATGESIKVGGRTRVLNLKQDTADPMVGAISLKAAQATLADALERLPELAGELERGVRALEHGAGAIPFASLGRLAREPKEPLWFLALDEVEPSELELRPRLPFRGQAAPTGPSIEPLRAAAPLSEVVKPLVLDPLTVADDGKFLETIKGQKVLPAFVRNNLESMY